MSKLLGYYCNIASGSILERLQSLYGCQFEKMHRKLKIYLLVCIASSLSEELQRLDCDLTSPEVTEVIDLLHWELTPHDKENLVIALAHLIREQKEAPEG